MTRDDLATASDLLASAAERTGEGAPGDRLRDLAGQLETLAERDRGPDHGRLARIETALDDVVAAVDDEAASEIDAAHDHVVAFRETVEGV